MALVYLDKNKIDYNFKIIYRPGCQNNVADALSRIEPISLEEMLEIENKKQILVATRAQKAQQQNNQNDCPKYTIDEKNGTILNKRGFDLIFHLIPNENDTLKNQIMNKFGITKFSNEFHKFNNIHYCRTISNQFANRMNVNNTQKCIKNILQISEDIQATDIAINIDFDNVKHYIYFKSLFEEIFTSKPISTTFFLNKIVELKEQDDIDTILDLYHKSLLGGHAGVDRMCQTISKFYKWNNMTNDIKNYVKNCEICEKTKIIKHTKMPMEISSLGEVLFDHTYVDVVGPIQASEDGHKYIITMECDLTKFVVAIPTMDCTAATTA